MKPLLLGGAMVVLAAAVFSTVGTSGLTALVSQSGGNTKACIEEVNMRDQSNLSISDFNAQHVHLNTDGNKDVVLKNSSDKYCGSAGCVFELCLATKEGIQLLPFSYAGESLKTESTLNDGMYDITLTGKSELTFSWDYSRYIHSN